MPLKQKEYFNIIPNNSIRYPDGTFFVYVDNEYLVRDVIGGTYKKIVPWEIFNVTVPLVTKELKEKYKNGATWLRERGKWIYIGEYLNNSGTTSPEAQGEGIGFWTIEDDFIVQ